MREMARTNLAICRVLLIGLRIMQFNYQGSGACSQGEEPEIARIELPVVVLRRAKVETCTEPIIRKMEEKIDECE
jgi:hypothetical protein